MSMYRVFSCVVGRGCLLWPVHFLVKTLLVFALLHSIFQGQICLLLQVFLDFLLLHSSHLYWKGHLFWVLVLKDLVGLPRTVQLQLLQRYWLGHRLGLLWYWMVCFGKEQGSFCCEKCWAGWSTSWIKNAGKCIINLRYADDTTLTAESEELKGLLMKVKEESEKVVLKLNLKKN